mgnify:CR=1 FL=1
MGVVVVSWECDSIFDKLGFRPIAFQIGLRHKGFRTEYGVRLRVGHANPANGAAQFLSLDSPCGWGNIWDFGVFLVPREWKPCLGNVLCRAVLGSLVWEMWRAGRLAGRFSGVELHVCFSLGSGFGEFSSWGYWSSQTEPKLKQMPCLVGCKSAGLGFWFVVGVLPGAYGLAGCGILAKAGLVPGRDLAACVLSLVFVWCVLLVQGECWPEMRVQA